MQKVIEHTLVTLVTFSVNERQATFMLLYFSLNFGEFYYLMQISTGTS